MSMREWTEKGYGFPVFYNGNEIKVAKFIADNTGKFDERCQEGINSYLIPAIEEDDDFEIEEILRDMFDNNPAWAIAEIINDNEGISIIDGFMDDGDTGTVDTVMAYPSFPWQMNDKDKELDEVKIHEILKKYADALDIPEILIDYQELSYFG